MNSIASTAGLRVSSRVLCVLLLGTIAGCQLPRATTPMERRHELLEMRTQAPQQPDLRPQDDQTEMAVAAHAVQQDAGHAPATAAWTWTGWLDRLPRPPRVPLPRTDMGGSNIVVLAPQTAAADSDRR